MVEPVLVTLCIWFHSVMLTSFSPTGVRRVANRAYVGNGFVTDATGFAIYAFTLAAVSFFVSTFQPLLQISLSNFLEQWNFWVVNGGLAIVEFVLFLHYVVGRQWGQIVG